MEAAKDSDAFGNSRSRRRIKLVVGAALALAVAVPLGSFAVDAYAARAVKRGAARLGVELTAES